MSPLTSEQQDLVEANMGLVVSIARGLMPWRLPKEDVMQAGTMGLIRAIQGHDPRLGELSTYAYRHIKSAILNAEARSAIIRVPPWDKRRGDPKYLDLATRARRVVSLAAFATDPTASPSTQEDDDPVDVRAALRYLPARERDVIESTVLGDETLKDAAARLGVTKQAACQTRKAALARLRRLLAHYAEAG